MKKLALILALCMLVPASAFGLEMMSDTAMEDVTAQSGVSIALDDVQVFINIDTMAYIDCDGYSGVAGHTANCTGEGGAITISNFQIDMLNLNAIVATVAAAHDNQLGGTGNGFLTSTTCGDIPLFYNYATATALGCTLTGTAVTLGMDNLQGNFAAAPIEIDVTSRLPALTEGYQYNAGGTAFTVGGVMIGLPTVELYIQNMILTPAFTSSVSTNTTAIAANNNKDYGTFQMDGITMSVFSGWLEIAPH
jgi:hypothetical protein